MFILRQRNSDGTTSIIGSSSRHKLEEKRAQILYESRIYRWRLAVWTVGIREQVRAFCESQRNAMWPSVPTYVEWGQVEPDIDPVDFAVDHWSWFYDEFGYDQDGWKRFFNPAKLTHTFKLVDPEPRPFVPTPYFREEDVVIEKLKVVP